MEFRIGHAADAASYLGLSSEEVLHFPGCIESIKHSEPQNCPLAYSY
jgi:hypothetical protein